MKKVSIFGKSTVDKNTTDYQLVKDLAKRVVLSGFGVIHGGYAGGMMEAVAEGAQEAIEEKGLSSDYNLGIPEERFDKDWPRVTRALFSVPAPDIFDRLRLVTAGDVVVIAPIGGDGTALELDTVIHENLVSEALGLAPKPLIIIETSTGTKWKAFLESRSLLTTSVNIFEKDWIYFASSVEEAASLLVSLLLK